MELIQGNEACARGALAAGLKFFGGYPISPSSEIAEILSSRLPRAGGVFVQMEDEMASLGSVIGASLGGLRAMTATSGPGFTLMQEHLGYASLAEIPCVVIDVMRVGPSTGVPTAPSQGDVMQARWGSHGDRAALALAPASVAEVYELTVQAFNIADRLRAPVVVMFDEVIGHMREGVELVPPRPEDIWRRPDPVGPPGSGHRAYAPNEEGVAQMPRFGDGYRFHVTGLFHDERGYPSTNAELVRQTLERLERKLAPVPFWLPPEKYRLGDASFVFVAYGAVSRVAREAVDRLREEGVAAGLYRPRVLWTVADAQLREDLAGAETVVVAELNRGQWVDVVARALPRSIRIVSHGKSGGEPVTTDELLAAAADLQPRSVKSS